MVSCDFASFCPHDSLSRDSGYQGDRETQRLKDAHRFSAEMTPRRARWHPDYSIGNSANKEARESVTAWEHGRLARSVASRSVPNVLRSRHGIS